MKTISRKISLKTVFQRISTVFVVAILFVACGGKTVSKRQIDDSVEQVPHLSEQEFDKKFGNYDVSTHSFAYNGGKPVIIDFYAVWCGPCKVLSPIIEELAEEYKDKAEFFKVDVDSEKQLATRYGISSIPTLFFISAKGEVRVASGLMSKSDLKAVIDNMLLK